MMPIFCRRLLPLALAGLCVFVLSRVDLSGYATVGHTWGTNQVFYYINPNSVWLSPSAAISGIQAGAQIWGSQSLANIQLVYGGSTNGTSLTLNNKNEVFFRNDSNGYVGETYWWYDASGHLIDADVVFHEGGYHYYSGSGCSGGVYLEDAASHEFGHALGLAHSSVAGATMQPAIPSYCDLTETTLESDDIAGIESLYPPTSTVKNTAPGVSISSPASGSTFSSGAAITFSGSATDRQDGDLSSSLGWTSSINGSLGYGGSLSRALSSGTHTITATVRDSGGLSASAQVTITVAAATSGGPSPDGTIVPTNATQIIDNTGVAWTIGSGGAILRNGSQAAGGWGSQILWKSGTIYVFGTDGNWWKWTGSGWLNVGRTIPGGGTASPDGTTVPINASQIVDNAGAVWTIGAGGAILRNAFQAAGGWGSQILWKNSTIYVLGTDTNWWQWTGSGWLNVGRTTPGGGTSTSPDGTTVPINASQIVDNTGAVWTIGAGGAILRNAFQAAGGWGSQILWKNSRIYVLGTDANWWQWTGSAWLNVGRTTPGGGGASPDGTTVPINASQIVDNSGAVWTIGASMTILRNGTWAAGGFGSQILWKNGTIYVLGTDINWWQWVGAGWVNVGPVHP